MIRVRKPKALILLMICLFSAVFSLERSFGQQITPEKQEKSLQAESKPEKIIPSPKNIKERTALYVFIGWMWLAIFVLIFILRLKIKEADRLYRLKFFLKNKK